MALRIWLGLLVALTFAMPVTAAEQTQTYDVYIKGIKAGQMQVRSKVEGNRYGLSASVRATGLVGAVVNFGFSGTAQGSVRRSGDLRPSSYVAKYEARGRLRNTRMQYAGGVPRPATITPARDPRPYDAKPENQRGTLDPISAMFELVGNAPVGEACNKTVQIFDGSKRSQIQVGKRRAEGDLWICPGTYTRIQGWAADDLAERTNFNFELVFREVDGVMISERFQTQSLYGRVTAERR